MAKGLLDRLVARKQAGPAEDALDAFIPLLQQVLQDLSGGVDGQTTADAKRRALLQKLDVADADVDTWLRHHISYIGNEAQRRNGPHAAEAQSVLDAAFADGLQHVDDAIPTENRECRKAIKVLELPENAAILTAIGLPADWTPKWKTALDTSDDLYQKVQDARTDKKTKIDDGVDAEAEMVDVVVRLRKYIASRASRTDHAKIAEGRELLAPLTSVLKQKEATRAARATKKKNEQKDPPAQAAQPTTSTSAQPASATSTPAPAPSTPAPTNTSTP